MIEGFIIAWVSVLAFTLLVISIRAYKRSQRDKILLVSGAFGIFFAKGVVLSIGLFWETFTYDLLFIFATFCDFGILLLLFVATLKRF